MIYKLCKRYFSRYKNRLAWSRVDKAFENLIKSGNNSSKELASIAEIDLFNELVEIGLFNPDQCELIVKRWRYMNKEEQLSFLNSLPLYNELSEEE